MNLAKSLRFFALALVISTTVVGCKKGLQRPTPLPGGRAGLIGAEPTGPIEHAEGLVPLGPSDYSGWDQDRQTFAPQTVYFDFDQSNIRSSEVPKLEEVASQLKSMSGKALRVEGHCDERGTEEYNRALGERRALSAREYLVRLGVDPNKVVTISYGEERPDDPGHNQAAWSKNRRAEFILLSPPAGGSASLEP